MYLRSLWRDQLCDSVVNLHRSHPAAEPKGYNMYMYIYV